MASRHCIFLCVSIQHEMLNVRIDSFCGSCAPSDEVNPVLVFVFGMARVVVSITFNRNAAVLIVSDVRVFHLDKAKILSNQQANRKKEAQIDNISVDILPPSGKAKYPGHTITFRAAGDDRI